MNKENQNQSLLWTTLHRKQLEATVSPHPRMESIGTLAGGIAHDLNNVCWLTLMSAQLLQMKASDDWSQSYLKLWKPILNVGGFS